MGVDIGRAASLGENLLLLVLGVAVFFFSPKTIIDLTNGRFAAPILVLWGKHDPVVKFNVAEYYAAHIPTAKLQLIEKASHSPQLERPEAVADAIISFTQ